MIHQEKSSSKEVLLSDKNMGKDSHLGTGEYNPEKYWSERARHSHGSCLSAVCVFGATNDENESAHRVQKSAICKVLKDLDIKGKDVLEYGCGAGRWIPLFQQYGSTWHGVDISKDMLSMAKKAYKDVDLKKIIDNKIPYPDQSMDLVYSVTVLHHNPYSAQEKIMSEMIRVLRDGKYLLLLEDLGEKGQFNMFPRNRMSWIELVERYRMILCWQGGVRYWILRGLACAVRRHLLPIEKMGGNKNEMSNSNQPFISVFIRRLLGQLDLIIDPYIWQIVPKRFQSTAVMLFKKNETRQ